jgi:hypothetical protein
MPRQVTLIDMLRAIWHGARALYYGAALRHVGHTHPDSAHLTRKYLRELIARDDLLAP